MTEPPPPPAPPPAAVPAAKAAAPPPLPPTHPPTPPAFAATVDISPDAAGAGGATGVYEPVATQAFDNVPGQALHPTQAGATGEFVPENRSAPSGANADPNATVAVGAVGGYDPTIAATCDGDGASAPRPSAKRI